MISPFASAHLHLFRSGNASIGSKAAVPMKILSIALLVSVESVSAALAGEKQAAPFVVQAQVKGFTWLAEVVQAIGEGDGTNIIGPGTNRQSGGVPSGRVAINDKQPGTVIVHGAT